MRYVELCEGESRLERAKALGFDTSTVYYHGTGHDFLRFSPKFHGTNMGAHLREPFAVWLTDNPVVAQVYAEYEPHDGLALADPAIVAKLQQTLSPDEARSRLLASLQQQQHPESQQDIQAFMHDLSDDDVYRSLSVYGDKPKQPKQPLIMPMFVRLKNPMVIDCAGFNHYALMRHKGSYIKRAKDARHDAIIFRNAEDGSEHRSDIVGVFNPKNVRSIFAQFEPSATGRSGLLEHVTELMEAEPSSRERRLARLRAELADRRRQKRLTSATDTANLEAWIKHIEQMSDEDYEADRQKWMADDLAAIKSGIHHAGRNDHPQDVLSGDWYSRQKVKRAAKRRADLIPLAHGRHPM